MMIEIDDTKALFFPNSLHKSFEQSVFYLFGTRSRNASVNPHIHHFAYHTSSSIIIVGLRRGGVGGILPVGFCLLTCSALVVLDWLSSRPRCSSLDRMEFLLLGVLTFLLNLESTLVSTAGFASQNNRLSSVSCVLWREPRPPPSGPYESDACLSKRSTKIC